MKIGIVGRGYGRYGLLPAFRMVKGVSIEALCATRMEVVLADARDANIPRAYDDWRRMLANEQLDAIVVAVPPRASGPICRAALSIGLPLFTEKLPAATLSEVRELNEIAQRSAITTCIDYIFPELETFRRAKDLLSDGAIGTIRLVEVRWMFESYDNRMGLRTWKTNSNEGGGVLRHFLCHSLHYVEWFLGRIERVRATLVHDANIGSGGDCYVSVTSATESGVLVNLVGSSVLPKGPGHSVAFYGSAGTLSLENPLSDVVRGFALTLGTSERRKMIVTEEEHSTVDESVDARVGASAALAQRFVDALSGSPPRRPFPALREALRVSTLIEAICNSNSLDRSVRLDKFAE